MMKRNSGKKRLVIGMSGASGAPLTVEVLKRLKNREDIETHLIVTKAAMLTLRQETDLTPEQFLDLADVYYDNDCIGARPASGSFGTEGMLIVPCSMKTVAGIVSGYSDNLLLRAADVTLKERRRLVLAAREMPLGTVHLRNLYEISRLGAVIVPPMLTYYQRPDSLEACTAYAAERMLQQFGLGEDSYEWDGV